VGDSGAATEGDHSVDEGLISRFWKAPPSPPPAEPSPPGEPEGEPD